MRPSFVSPVAKEKLIPRPELRLSTDFGLSTYLLPIKNVIEMIMMIGKCDG